MSIGYINLVRYAVRQATIESRLPYTMLRKNFLWNVLALAKGRP